MPIHHCVIHFLEKKPDDSPASLNLSAEPLSDQDKLENLLADLNHHYNSKPSKSWAFFNNNQSTGLAQQLELLLTEQLDFYSLSEQLAKAWQKTLNEQQIFMRAHLCLMHYRQGAGDYLLITFLPQTQGFSINAALELTDVQHLDLSQMSLAARINLSEWRNNPKSKHYISLLKAKGGKKVTEAFAEFIGCEEGADAPSETRTLLQAFSDYVDDNELSEEHVKEKTNTLVRYANQQSRQGDAVALTELSEVLDEENPQAFYNHIRNKDYGLSPYVPTDRRTLSQFQRFSGRAEGLSISFEAHLLGSKVEYDEAQDTLIIRNLPTQLKDQLKRQN